MIQTNEPVTMITTIVVVDVIITVSSVIIVSFFWRSLILSPLFSLLSTPSPLLL